MTKKLVTLHKINKIMAQKNIQEDLIIQNHLI